MFVSYFPSFNTCTLLKSNRWWQKVYRPDITALVAWVCKTPVYLLTCLFSGVGKEKWHQGSRNDPQCIFHQPVVAADLWQLFVKMLPPISTATFQPVVATVSHGNISSIHCHWFPQQPFIKLLPLISMATFQPVPRPSVVSICKHSVTRFARFSVYFKMRDLSSVRVGQKRAWIVSQQPCERVKQRDKYFGVLPALLDYFQCHCCQDQVQHRLFVVVFWFWFGSETRVSGCGPPLSAFVWTLARPKSLYLSSMERQRRHLTWVRKVLGFKSQFE